MIKRAVTLLWLAGMIIMSCSTSESGYVIEGKITGEGSESLTGTMYLKNQEFGGRAIDSAIIQNGKFVFRGVIEDPDRFIIYNPQLPNNIPIFIENTKYKISAPINNLNEAVVIGGETQNLIDLAERKSKEVIEELNLNSIMKDFSDPNTPQALKDSIISVFNTANTRMRNFYDSILMQNQNTWFFLFHTKLSAQGENPDTLQNRYDRLKLNPKFANSGHLAEIREVIQAKRSLEPGQPVKDFKLNDINGKESVFSEIIHESNYTILLFWSDWSIESIKFAKEIKDIVGAFDSKQIKIIGVILSGADQEIKKKEAIIKDEGLTFLNLIDANENPTASLYNVTLIPRAFLVGRDNKIIMNDVKVNDLKSFLETIR